MNPSHTGAARYGDDGDQELATRASSPPRRRSTSDGRAGQGGSAGAVGPAADVTRVATRARQRSAQRLRRSPARSSQTPRRSRSIAAPGSRADRRSASFDEPVEELEHAARAGSTRSAQKANSRARERSHDVRAARQTTPSANRMKPVQPIGVFHEANGFESAPASRCLRPDSSSGQPGQRLTVRSRDPHPVRAALSARRADALAENQHLHRAAEAARHQAASSAPAAADLRMSDPRDIERRQQPIRK